jgi:hypothetical protein
MPTHSSSSSSPPEGVLRAALALVHARLDPKLALAVLIVFCFRRVLSSHWSPYDPVRVVNADP